MLVQTYKISSQCFLTREDWQITQKPWKYVQQFVTGLHQAAGDCAFAADSDNQIGDAVLSACTLNYIKKKLLEERN